MFKMPTRIAAFLFAAVCVGPLLGVVRTVHVLDRQDVLGGKPFGAAGPYEKIIAKARFAVDPSKGPNRIITDIDRAPRNEKGLVEFEADIYVLKPRDPALGNGTALFEVSNRGNKGIVGMFNNTAGSLDPSAEKDFGDGFLMERGYTVVWVGWQFDVADKPELMRLYAPVATEGGNTITGLVRSEYITDAKTYQFSLGDRNTHLPYAVADPDDPANQLTVRDRCDSERRPIPRSAWKFGRKDGEKFRGDMGWVYMEAGFEPGKIYEMVYRAKDPVVVGLGPAAVRDFISFLKYNAPNTPTAALGDQGRFIKRAIAFGTSQSGRFLRTFLFYGFNQDEENRKVFDGVWSHVAGGGRGSFNHRFAQPSRDGHPHMNCSYPTDIFPFTDLPETDAETGLAGGILSRAMEAKVTPKVFYTNSSYEYWGRSAGLIHASLDGKQDAPLAPDTRAYLLTGTQHGPGSFPPRQGAGRNLANGNDYRWILRSLLVRMNDWIANGKEPPAAAIPRVDRDQLVTVGAVNWPKIPGSALPERPQRAWRADYGPDFRSKGVVTQEPPKLGNAFTTLVPQVDRDGNETSGILAPMIQAPLATFTGWNLRKPEQGAPDEIYSMVGSTFFFARTKAERAKTGDPRPSIEERYKNKQDYMVKYTSAAQSLVASGYLLESDLPKILELGASYWDAVMIARK